MRCRSFYSLGNFLSHQTSPENMLGGMASVTICMDRNRRIYRRLRTAADHQPDHQKSGHRLVQLLPHAFVRLHPGACCHAPHPRLLFWTPCRRFLIKLSPAPPDKENPYLFSFRYGVFVVTARAAEPYTRQFPRGCSETCCASIYAPMPSRRHQQLAHAAWIPCIGHALEAVDHQHRHDCRRQRRPEPI